jgi:hypothetical protein
MTERIRQYFASCREQVEKKQTGLGSIRLEKTGLCGLGLGQSGSDDKVDHIIIGALSLPTKKGTTSLPMDFYTPEPSSDSHWHIFHKGTDAGADPSPA